MIRPRPPPTIRRASKALVAAVVGFVAFPGTLTTTAVLLGTQTTPSIALEPLTIAACAVAAALVAAALFATARTPTQ